MCYESRCQFNQYIIYDVTFLIRIFFFVIIIALVWCVIGVCCYKYYINAIIVIIIIFTPDTFPISIIFSIVSVSSLCKRHCWHNVSVINHKFFKCCYYCSLIIIDANYCQQFNDCQSCMILD